MQIDGLTCVTRLSIDLVALVDPCVPRDSFRAGRTIRASERKRFLDHTGIFERYDSSKKNLFPKKKWMDLHGSAHC